MLPLKLKAPLKDYIWGGTKLITDFNKKTDLNKVAESWELSCHKDGQSVIENGEFAGMTLSDYITKKGKKILGTDCEKFEEFPVLIKLIDAKDNLSVQVHPDNEYAMRVEGEYGKTEMWYIVDCDEGASLLYGFKEKISKDKFAECIENNTLLDVANSVSVKKGDVFFIEAGTLHAIGKGILIAEIQQNSNTTYRVYDYGRVGVDGKPRELHVEKAKDVTKLEPPTRPVKPEGAPIKKDGYTQTLLSSCEYFTVNVLDIDTEAVLSADDKSFNSLLCLEGAAEVISADGEKVSMEKGDSVFIEADFGKYTVKGHSTVVLTTV